MKTWWTPLALVVICGCARPGSRPEMAAPPKALDTIPRGDPIKYRAIRDAKDWQNPFLIVEADGYVLISGGARQAVKRGDLGATLSALGPEAWPYGRILGAQEQGIRTGESSVEANGLAEQKKMLEETLAKLSIELEWWPSS